MDKLESTPFRSLVAVLVHGADTRKFMQGQLSSDVRTLSRTRALLGSYSSVQGRVQAVLTLVEREEGLMALLPAPTSERVVARLRASVLGSKLSLETLGWSLRSASRVVASAAPAGSLSTPGSCAELEDGSTLLRWWSAEERYLSITRATTCDPAESCVQPAHDAEDQAFRRANIHAGLPQVYLETQASFIPQMLNLDLLGGVSFDKGCYVGQEVVARARRGGVPRRMFGFAAACCAPAPGTPIVQAGQEVGLVVDAVDVGMGCLLLAVVEVEQAAGTLALAGESQSLLTPAPLPYAVPTTRK